MDPKWVEVFLWIPENPTQAQSDILLLPTIPYCLSPVALLLSTVPFSSYVEQLTFLIADTESLGAQNNGTWFHSWDQQPKSFLNILLASKSLRLSIFSCYSYVQGSSGSRSLKSWDWARAADTICPRGLCFLSVQIRMGRDQEVLLHL